MRCPSRQKSKRGSAQNRKELRPKPIFRPGSAFAGEPDRHDLACGEDLDRCPFTLLLAAPTLKERYMKNQPTKPAKTTRQASDIPWEFECPPRPKLPAKWEKLVGLLRALACPDDAPTIMNDAIKHLREFINDALTTAVTNRIWSTDRALGKAVTDHLEVTPPGLTVSVQCPFTWLA